jgi:putative ABC transport system ATP-binding protein
MSQAVSGKDSIPLLQVEDLSFQRQGGMILKQVSLLCQQGQLTILTGPSAGGKSTLLRLLNRLDEPTAGRVLLHGVDTRNLPPVQLRCRISMVLQRPTMFAGTVLENLQSSFRLRQEPLPLADSAAIQRVLTTCDIDSELLSRSAERLSIGQQQRVSLARALLTAPQVLLLDEPTSALDRPSADRLGALLRQLCRDEGLAVLMISHDLRLTERVADQVLFLSAGEIVERGGAGILRQPNSEQLCNFLNDSSLRKQEGAQ